jgi:nitroreductase
MPLLETHLLTRRSLAFPLIGEPAPSALDIEKILLMAARVPDHGKLSPWRFIVIPKNEGAKLGEKLVALALKITPTLDEKALSFERNRLARAPLCIAVVSTAAQHPKIPVWEQQLSAGAVCMNLLHAATSLGYGGTWVTEWLAYNDEAKALLGILPSEKLAGFIHLGRPLGKPEERVRPVISDITTHFKG